MEHSRIIERVIRATMTRIASGPCHVRKRRLIAFQPFPASADVLSKLSLSEDQLVAERDTIPDSGNGGPKSLLQYGAEGSGYRLQLPNILLDIAGQLQTKRLPFKFLASRMADTGFAMRLNPTTLFVLMPMRVWHTLAEAPISAVCR